MRIAILLLTVFAMLAPAAEETVDVEHTDHLYMRVYKGSNDGIERSMEGTLVNRNKIPVATFEIIDVEDILSVARISMMPDRQVYEIDSARIEAIKDDDVHFTLENEDTFMILHQGSEEGVSKGWKGQLFTSEGELVGFFRVLSVEEEKSTAIAYSLALGMDYGDAEKAEFQGYIEQIGGTTGLANFSWLNLVMILIGFVFIYLAVTKDYEPLLLVPIGFGILLGNIPLPVQLFNSISVYMIDPLTQQYVFNTNPNSVLGVIYSLVTTGFLPPIIFLGIGAMTDFSALLSNPKTVMLGAAAQIGIFLTFIGAFLLDFTPAQAASIGIIGGADGPTAIFLTSQLAPTLIGPIAIAAYSYMGLIPIIQPPLMRLLTTKKERLIRMKPGRKVGKVERIIFPIAAFLVTTFIAPGAIPLLGMLFFGNLLKESGVTNRLAKTASNALIDSATILLGIGVGASTTAQVFLNAKSVYIFILGCAAFGIATISGLLFAKLMNVFLKEGDKINPLIGSSGVSAVPDAARVSEMIGREYDPNNHLLMHAMGPNVAGVIGSGIAAGILLGIF
jgi:oxaloacetate decarboxylase beta subunit